MLSLKTTVDMDAEAPLVETAVELWSGLYHFLGVFSSSGLSLVEVAVDICPERVDAADAKGPKPRRIETAVEF